eukprot:5882176-Alexandrium_andersonii.AAC.1
MDSQCKSTGVVALRGLHAVAAELVPAACCESWNSAWRSASNHVELFEAVWIRFLPVGATAIPDPPAIHSGWCPPDH